MKFRPLNIIRILKKERYLNQEYYNIYISNTKNKISIANNLDLCGLLIFGEFLLNIFGFIINHLIKVLFCILRAFFELYSIIIQSRISGFLFSAKNLYIVFPSENVFRLSTPRFVFSQCGKMRERAFENLPIKFSDTAIISIQNFLLFFRAG